MTIVAGFVFLILMFLVAGGTTIAVASPRFRLLGIVMATASFLLAAAVLGLVGFGDLSDVDGVVGKFFPTIEPTTTIVFPPSFFVD